MSKILRCGHAANATDGSGRPSCAICCCSDVAEHQPTLTGRRARCRHFGHVCSGRGTPPEQRGRPCVSERPSDPGLLAFFEHRPGEPFDRYYCGCWGWD